MRFIAALILCSIGGCLTAEILIQPVGRWVLAIMAALVISFLSSLFICKKLGVE
ncbi:hypothetical protein [Serratia sp. 14-2641]|uniref:hypothetical protein n=1 Tax=Serratia sp. 14-2641 TaxID=1841657 RepID=UPI00130112D9|nr:hypothetical protein [Serratia sp. 14-2641]